MKNSIARRVRRQVSLLLVAAMIVLFVGAYHLVSKVIYQENEKYALAILGIYTDLLVEESHENHIPIDAEHSDKVIRYGETLCDWYAVDYVYLYTIDEANSTVTYIAASAVDGKVENPPTDHLVGYTAKWDLHPEELAVWRGEKFVGHITANNNFGHEVSTLLRIEDDFGNRMIAGVDVAYRDIQQKILQEFALLATIIVLVLIGINAAVYLIIRKRVSQPAQRISKSMTDFITDGKRSGEKLEVNSKDEFGMIAAAFNSMTDDIDNYLDSIRTLNQAQARQHTELDIAGRIQKGFLPKEHLCTDRYEIRAMMMPAKNVGGDLYDYLPLDDHRVLVVIADVTGKGITAAMFMSVTLMLIRQYAKMGLSPAEILQHTNDTLSENNAEMLFATAFLGIYDSTEQSFTYANAGHNFPYLIGKTLRTLNGAKSAALGLFDDSQYTQETVPLRIGETLFLYTDGVNEAVNEAEHFYGTERLEAVLSAHRAAHGENPVRAVWDDVCAFAGAAEQHDDVTMLALDARNTRELLLDIDVHEMVRIKEAILALPLERALLLNLCLAAEECFVNICSYAFPDGIPDEEKVRFTLSLSDRVTMRFSDGGRPYDPTKHAALAEDYDLDTQLGGLGKFLAVSVVDDVQYEYRDQKNILTLTKYFKEEPL